MTEQKLWINLTEEEQQTLAALQAELDLSSPEEVMRVLLLQAHSRAAISCPACGHSAQLTAADQAKCTSCLSIIELSDEIWTLAATRA